MGVVRKVAKCKEGSSFKWTVVVLVVVVLSGGAGVWGI